MVPRRGTEVRGDDVAVFNESMTGRGDDPYDILSTGSIATLRDVKPSGDGGGYQILHLDAISGDGTSNAFTEIMFSNNGVLRFVIGTGTDDVLYLYDPVGVKTPLRIIPSRGTIALEAAPTVPATAAAAGTKGEVSWDSGFIYVCVDTNTWKRVAIATW